MATNKRRGERFISVEEVCDRTGWDPMTVFDKADSGEIPGAVWGGTLRFKEEEIGLWLRGLTSSEVEEALKSLEQKGLITSFIDSNGERRYIVIKQLH